MKKTKYTLFHKKSVRDNIPLKLQDLKIATLNDSAERTTSIKFLGVIIYENITWEDHIYTIEIKLANNIGLLYQEHILDNESIKTIYLSYIAPNICQPFMGQYVFYQTKNSTLSTKTCFANYLQSK